MGQFESGKDAADRFPEVLIFYTMEERLLATP
jgi:hypothetical protein